MLNERSNSKHAKGQGLQAPTPQKSRAKHSPARDGTRVEHSHHGVSGYTGCVSVHWPTETRAAKHLRKSMRGTFPETAFASFQHDKTKLDICATTPIGRSLLRHGDCAFSYGTHRTNAKIEMTTQPDELYAPHAQRTAGALDRTDDLNNRSDSFPFPDRPTETHPAGPHDTGKSSNLSALSNTAELENSTFAPRGIGYGIFA